MTIDEAIERIENRKFSMSMCVNKDECLKENEAIEIAILALRKQKYLDRKTTGWISVEDRLPIEGSTCLVFATNEEYGGMVTIGFKSNGMVPNVDGFYMIDDDYVWDNFKVTHWQPLPEPPKGE